MKTYIKSENCSACHVLDKKKPMYVIYRRNYRAKFTDFYFHAFRDFSLQNTAGRPIYYSMCLETDNSVYPIYLIHSWEFPEILRVRVVLL